MSWLEVRVTVSGELAEPVAEVLSRHCPAGVVITADHSQKTEMPLGQAMTVAGYLPQNEQTTALKKQIQEDLWHLSQIQEIPEPTFEKIEETDWLKVWKKDYQPIPIGNRLLIQPPWLEPSWGDRAIVQIDPGMAFGTGTHPTTILCLEIIEQILPTGGQVLDIGCGSGILSIAAVKLGASRVSAYDTDIEAVKATQSNATDNSVAQSIDIKQGSLQDAFEDFRGKRKPDLIVANILAKVLRQFFVDGIPELMGKNTHLVISGILEMQADAVTEAAEQAGLRKVQAKMQRDWVAMVLKKNPALK